MPKTSKLFSWKKTNIFNYYTIFSATPLLCNTNYLIINKWLWKIDALTVGPEDFLGCLWEGLSWLWRRQGHSRNGRESWTPRQQLEESLGSCWWTSSSAWWLSSQEASLLTFLIRLCIIYIYNNGLHKTFLTEDFINLLCLLYFSFLFKLNLFKSSIDIIYITD